MSCPCLRPPQLHSAGRTLKITEAKLEDSGRYTCLATNAAGEAKQHIRLSVHGKVQILHAFSLLAFSVSLISRIMVYIIIPSTVCDQEIRSKCERILTFLTVCLSEPPSISSSGDIINQTILSGFSTSLECKATGRPLPGENQIFLVLLWSLTSYHWALQQSSMGSLIYLMYRTRYSSDIDMYFNTSMYISFSFTAFYFHFLFSFQCWLIMSKKGK